MVSLKDISIACNVSVATVSKALNDHKDISEKKKEEIRRVAKEMGYFPNSAAKALKTNRTYNIGVLFVDGALSGLTHDYFAAVLDSFKSSAEEKGYDITFINCSKSRPNRMPYLEHVKYRGFDGVAIACIDFTDPDVIELVHGDVPIVTIDYIFNNRTAVLSDNVKGMSELLSYIYSVGHRKIAYIHGEDVSAVTKNRLSAFYRTAEELGITVPDAYVKTSIYRNTKECYRLTGELLNLPDPPTCILYPDDFACIGGINAIKERGLRIPEDISVAGYDGIKVARHMDPKLTTVRQNTKEIGSQAALSLIELIENPKTALTQQVIIPGEVYEGASVGKLG